MPARDPRPLVLDTNALSDAGFLHFLRAYARPRVIPAVALMEIARLYHVRGWDPRRLLSLLAVHGIEVEAFEGEHAIATAYRAVDATSWRAGLADSMIAAHVHGDRILVTNNVKDFGQLRPASVMTPSQAVRAWGRR